MKNNAQKFNAVAKRNLGAGLHDLIRDRKSFGTAINAIKQGAYLNVRDELGNSHLITAIAANQPVIVDMLLEREVSLGYKNKRGMDALSIAALRGDAKTAGKLIQKGAKLTESQIKYLGSLAASEKEGAKFAATGYEITFGKQEDVKFVLDLARKVNNYVPKAKR